MLFSGEIISTSQHTLLACFSFHRDEASWAPTPSSQSQFNTTSSRSAWLDQLMCILSYRQNFMGIILDILGDIKKNRKLSVTLSLKLFLIKTLKSSKMISDITEDLGGYVWDKNYTSNLTGTGNNERLCFWRKI